MNAPPSARPVSVALLALPESTPTALYGLYETCASVGGVWSQLTGERALSAGMRPQIVATRARRFRAAMGVPVEPHAALAEVSHADVVVVTDLELYPHTDPRERWPEAAAWLRARYAAGSIICSVCSGSLLLADAGLLDGREATTHWSVAPLLRRLYPAVGVYPERVLCPDGPEHRVVTSGGSASWQDLALYLIARFCGEAEAVRTAKVFLFGDRSEGQLPYAAMARSRRQEDAAIAPCLGWIAAHYDEDNPVARMETLSNLSPRSFQRRFRAATGYSPLEYVQALRVEEAKHWLETSSEPLETVAARVGYRDPAFFRRLFQRRTGVTPARYRQRFQNLLGPRSAAALHHRGRSTAPPSSGSIGNNAEGGRTRQW